MADAGSGGRVSNVSEDVRGEEPGSAVVGGRVIVGGIAVVGGRAVVGDSAVVEDSAVIRDSAVATGGTTEGATYAFRAT